MFNYKKVDKTCYKVYYENGKFVGELISKEDGYFDFWPDKETYGYWPSYGLRALADKLDELNKDWDEQIHKYFESKL